MLLQAKAANVTFILLGGGVEVERLKALAVQKLLSNVVFLPAVPMTEVGTYLAAADALLVHLKKDPLFTITIPSKTQAYMASGKPMLMAVDGDAADLVLDSGCGVVAESQNPQSIANAALALMQASQSERDSMAEKGLRFYREKLSLHEGVRRFGVIFQQLAKRK
ncbi:PEP-CTERM/exosortase A-associated glycosyltransferase [compost metagenome]